MRVTGGAYGAFCQLGRRSGTLQLLSYRDPNLLDTFAIFSEIGAALIESAATLTQEELHLAIIGAIGDLDSPQSPDQKGFASFVQWASGETATVRAAWRADILATRVEDIRAFGARLQDRSPGFSRACIASSSAVHAAANQSSGVAMSVTPLL